MRGVSAALRRLFQRRRRDSLNPARCNEDSPLMAPTDSQPKTTTPSSPAAQIHQTRGACLDSLDFRDHAHFSHLLAMAMAHGEALFQDEARLVAIIERFGREMTTYELKNVLYFSTFMDAAARYLTSPKVEAAVVEANPAVAVCFSWQQQQDVKRVLPHLQEDFTIVASLEPSLLRQPEYALAIAEAIPFQMGWVLQPAQTIIMCDLLGWSAESAAKTPPGDAGVSPSGFDTVALPNIHPSAQLHLLRTWLLTPGCVRRIDDSIREAFTADRLALPNPSSATTALFLDFATRHIDPRIVREVLSGLWNDASFVTGGRALLKGLICSSPNLGQLSVPAKILHMILSNAVRMCRHIRAVTECFHLEEAQRRRMNINVIQVAPKITTELIAGPHTTAAPTPLSGTGGRTVLYVAQHDSFLRLYTNDGGSPSGGPQLPKVAWCSGMVDVYTSTAPYDAERELSKIHAPHKDRTGKNQLNVWGMLLSDTTERMLPRAHDQPVTPADLEWLASIVTGIPDLGRLILGTLIEHNCARVAVLADASSCLGDHALPGPVLFVGGASGVDAHAAHCADVEALLGELGEFIFRGRNAATSVQVYSFGGTTHARLMGVLATALTYEDFEPELRTSAWWEPTLNELVVRLQREHLAIVESRHLRLSSALVLAWANRIGLLFSPRPTIYPLFPERGAVLYPKQSVDLARALLADVEASLATDYMDSSYPRPTAPRGSRILRLIITASYGIAPDYGIEKEQAGPCARLMWIQANRPHAAGGSDFWSEFLAGVAEHLFPRAHARTYMPVVRTRQAPPRPWVSAMPLLM